MHALDPLRALQVVVGAPHAVDFGKNMHYSPDGSAYAIATGAVGPQSYESWMQVE